MTNQNLVINVSNYLKQQFRSNMCNCAKFIVDTINRRDYIDECYILSRIDSADKMQELLNKFVSRYPAIQADAIIEDIDHICGGSY